ncbi:hypothetical protein F5Y11DRAFT_317982 [Daldinia sp. FL1419]|nr:hypothetical protein F5Y11DRAFT_317982 [Daldinia sp. FL1419]
MLRSWRQASIGTINEYNQLKRYRIPTYLSYYILLHTCTPCIILRGAMGHILRPAEWDVIYAYSLMVPSTSYGLEIFAKLGRQ